MNEESNNPADEVIESPEIESDESSTESPDASADPIDDDSEEVEHDGEKYKIPKALKSALMMQADYTRKTQEVAEQRKGIDADRQRFAQEADAHRADIQEYARLVAVDDQLRQFEQVDWQQLSNEDPVQAQQLWMRHAQLKEARQSLAGNLTQREQQRNFEAQQLSAKRMETDRAIVERDIKDWSPDLALKLREFATADGWSQAEIANVTAAQIKSLHRAYISAQLLQKQAPTAPKSPEAKPVTRVSGNTSVRKEPSKMTDSEFAAWRRGQIKNRN